MTERTIQIEDAASAEVRALVELHVGFARSVTPPEDVYALDAGGLMQPDITVWGLRAGGRLLAIGALRELDGTHGELKSMHTIEAVRGQGLGRALLEGLIAAARDRGYRRLSLETGAGEAFVPARGLYAKLGFRPCKAFGDYPDAPTSVFMSLGLDL